MAISIIKKLVFGPAVLRESVLQATTLVGALRLLFPAQGGGDAFAQGATVDFFREAVAAGGEVKDGVGRLLLAAKSGIAPTEALQKLIDSL